MHGGQWQIMAMRHGINMGKMMVGSSKKDNRTSGWWCLVATLMSRMVIGKKEDGSGSGGPQRKVVMGEKVASRKEEAIMAHGGEDEGSTWARGGSGLGGLRQHLRSAMGDDNGRADGLSRFLRRKEVTASQSRWHLDDGR